MGIISSKLRASAKGQPCTFQIAGVCNHDPETVVLCHLPSEIKGAGNKSDDWHAAFGCYACHEAIDQHRLSKEDELFYSFRALQRTQRYWIDAGLIVIPADLKTSGAPKTRPKKKTQWQSRPIQSRGFDKKPHETRSS